MARAARAAVRGPSCRRGPAGRGHGARVRVRRLARLPALRHRPEIGWLPIETLDGAVPPGPWLMWHTEQMRVPPGATELARSPAGPAAFSLGPHLAVQFHPEVGVEQVQAWAERDEHLAAVGLTPADVVAQSELHAPAAREQAFRLFDRWVERL